MFVAGAVLGELFSGARKSARPEANLAPVEEFAAASAVLMGDMETSRRYGETKERRRLLAGG